MRSSLFSGSISYQTDQMLPSVAPPRLIKTALGHWTFKRIGRLEGIQSPLKRKSGQLRHAVPKSDLMLLNQGDPMDRIFTSALFRKDDCPPCGQKAKEIIDREIKAKFR